MYGRSETELRIQPALHELQPVHPLPRGLPGAAPREPSSRLRRARVQGLDLEVPAAAPVSVELLPGGMELDPPLEQRRRRRGPGRRERGEETLVLRLGHGHCGIAGATELLEADLEKFSTEQPLPSSSPPSISISLSLSPLYISRRVAGAARGNGTVRRR